MNEKEMKEFRARIQANRIRTAERERKEMERLEREIKKEQKKELLIKNISIVILIIAVTLLVIRANKLDADFIENCTNGGNSYEFCKLATAGK